MFLPIGILTLPEVVGTHLQTKALPARPPSKVGTWVSMLKLVLPRATYVVLATSLLTLAPAQTSLPVFLA